VLSMLGLLELELSLLAYAGTAVRGRIGGEFVSAFAPAAAGGDQADVLIGRGLSVSGLAEAVEPLR
jgi:hypothetical protein